MYTPICARTEFINDIFSLLHENRFLCPTPFKLWPASSLVSMNEADMQPCDLDLSESDWSGVLFFVLTLSTLLEWLGLWGITLTMALLILFVFRFKLAIERKEAADMIDGGETTTFFCVFSFEACCCSWCCCCFRMLTKFGSSRLVAELLALFAAEVSDVDGFLAGGMAAMAVI